MADTRKLPLGRAQRLFKMAGAGARAGANFLLSKGNEKAAEQFAESLGTLRGLAAKIGQTLSYVDGILPEAQRETYEKALGTLRAAAPSSSAASIRELVEAELGAPLEQLFAEWSPEPFASASIGQVHRARLPDGRDVAVKVQHPGIDRALESDLGNVSMFEGLLAVVGPKKLDAGRIIEVVRQRFLEELDYGLEASHQAYFASVHAGDESIRIPQVIAERSAKRVLTSEFIHGKTLEEAATAPAERRTAYARALWRFVFKGNLIGGRFNADPHPGNYLFHDDGGVTFLDFGCVQPLGSFDLEHALRAHHAAIARDEATFRASIAALLGLKGGRFQEAVLDYSRQCFEPVFGSPFHITRDYVSGLVAAAHEMKKDIYAKDKSFVPPPPNLIFMNRLQFGFYSVLSRLDVPVDYAAVEREFLAAASATAPHAAPAVGEAG
jgi:predicted unusual protein kinase regulating ubiquinone biosynthesis (AarF/ABC1/UbiB family)